MFLVNTKRSATRGPVQKIGAMSLILSIHAELSRDNPVNQLILLNILCGRGDLQ